MIKVIAGAKGTGKTAQLVDDINEQAVQENNNIVCIERGNRLDRLLKYRIRLIDVDEYPCVGYEQLLSFIAGVCAKDYDLTHIYVDSVFKVAKDDNLDDLATFLNKLEDFLSTSPIIVTIICSSETAAIPEKMQKYC
jgi:hypothetical protein